MNRFARGSAALAVAAVLACAPGCGGSTMSPAAAAPDAAARAGPGGGARTDPARRQKITECLQAAGIAVPTVDPRPTGEPRPSGAPRGGQGGGFEAAFSSPEAKAALQACGITLPTGAPRPNGAPTPTPGA